MEGIEIKPCRPRLDVIQDAQDLIWPPDDKWKEPSRKARQVVWVGLPKVNTGNMQLTTPLRLRERVLRRRLL